MLVLTNEDVADPDYRHLWRKQAENILSSASIGPERAQEEGHEYLPSNRLTTKDFKILKYKISPFPYECSNPKNNQK